MDEQKAMSMAAQLRKPHGEWAEQIADFMAVGNAVLINRAIDAMNLSDNDNVLEIGMGKGKHVADMIAKAKNLQYTGYDYSEEMVELATATNDELVTRNVATFVHGDALSMPFAEDTFDKIVTVNTVYFWDDAQAVATEILRVLKPNGKFILGLRPERLMKTYPMTKFGFAMYSK
ncbi:MAG: class I SAM-dependent methyltransferase [Chitinophagaceae bacterium]|nr:class I SAM-dependent methyltransferase [Chitinophagaceae bacterium]